MKHLSILILALIATGCMTCREHPVACSIGAALLVGSAAATLEHHHDQMHERQIAPGGSPQCRLAPCGP